MNTPYLDQMIQNLEKYDKDGVLPNEGIDELNEYKAIKQALSLHNVSQQRELLRFVEVIKDIADMELHHWTNEEVVEYCIKKLQKSELILPNKHN